MTQATLASLLALAVSVLVLACSPEVPANPTYDKDVGPILNAHCVRCHSADFAPVFDPTTGTTDAPLLCHFNSRDGALANGCNIMIPAYVGNSGVGAYDNTRMPKPPSDRLNDWEIDVLKRWAANPV
jgi:hypothetical protein